MKAKLLSFAFINFLESSLFNGLRRIQIKNLALKALGVGGASIPFSVMVGLDPAIHENIAISS
jgi:hypothetical protein